MRNIHSGEGKSGYAQFFLCHDVDRSLKTVCVSNRTHSHFHTSLRDRAWSSKILRTIMQTFFSREGAMIELFELLLFSQE